MRVDLQDDFFAGTGSKEVKVWRGPHLLCGWHVSNYQQMGSTKDFHSWWHQHWQVRYPGCSQFGWCPVEIVTCSSHQPLSLLHLFQSLSKHYLWLSPRNCSVLKRPALPAWTMGIVEFVFNHFACSGRQSLTATFPEMESHNIDRESLYPVLAESRSVGQLHLLLRNHYLDE